jgi:hypothetical protein
MPAGAKMTQWFPEAGPAVIFPEALCHGAGPWNSEKDRISLFYKYNHVGMKLRPGFPTREAMEGMTPNQRLYFAEVNSDPRHERVPHPGTRCMRAQSDSIRRCRDSTASAPAFIPQLHSSFSREPLIRNFALPAIPQHGK